MKAESRSPLCYLRKLPVFSGLPASTLEALRDAAALHQRSRGTKLYGPGDSAEHVYCLHGGHVSVLRQSTGCRVINVGDFGAGDIFGESGLWSPAPRDNTAMATSSVLLSTIPSAVLRLVFDEYPAAERALVTQSIAHRESTLRRLCDALSLSIRARLAGQLLRLAEGGRDTPRGRELVVPLRHRELAALVVSTRETVSLELQRLEREQLIARLGRQIIVPDLRRLRAAACDDRQSAPMDPPISRASPPARAS